MRNLLFALAMLTFIRVAFAQEGKFQIDKEYKISKTGIIDLGSSDAKVFIIGSVRTSAHVKIDRTVTAKGWTSTPPAFAVDIEETKEGLRIRERQDEADLAFGYYDEEYRIEIEAPEGVSLTIRGDDGDYYIKNINGSISLSLDDADAELTDCKGDTFRFRFDDGDLRMNTAKGTLEVNADDADIEIYNAQFKSIDANIDDGDLQIETSLTNAGVYDIVSQDGTVSLDITAGGGEFNIHHDDGKVIKSAVFKTILESESETKVSLPNGTANVTIRADDANVKLISRKDI